MRLLALLAHAEAGMRADEVAEALGKSTSTAYNLLDTLCQEGFTARTGGGAYHLTAESAALVPADRAREVPAGLGGLLDELFERSHKRVYLAAAHSGQVVIPLARGRQGMPRMPGLGTRIGSNAHALALGKVALSLLDEPALDRYIGRGLRPFTRHTIVAPDQLRAQLQDIRGGAVAFDREEFDEDFCCLAKPVTDARGRAVAALGLSMSSRCFDTERDALAEVLEDVACKASLVLGGPVVPAISEDSGVLERAPQPGERSDRTTVQPPVPTGEEASP